MRVDKLTPEIYYKESRDFSYLGRIFEVLFNYMKTGADIVSTNPDNENVSDDLLELVCSTVGFESKHKYIKKDLVAVASNFVELCRNKGTLDAIRSAICLLLNSQNIDTSYDVDYEETGDKTKIKISVPVRLTDTILLEDLLEYILPAGVIYRIIFANPDVVPESKEIILNSQEATIHKLENEKDLVSMTAYGDENGQIENTYEGNPEKTETGVNSVGVGGLMYSGIVPSSPSEVGTEEEESNNG